MRSLTSSMAPRRLPSRPARRAGPRLADRHARRREGARGAVRLLPGRRSTPSSTSRVGVGRDRVAPIRTSFLQNAPACGARYRSYLPLFPLAIEQSSSSDFDLVLDQPLRRQGRARAAGRASRLLCHTPMRYAWDERDAYFPSRAARSTGCGIVSSTRCSAGTCAQAHASTPSSPTRPSCAIVSAAARPRRDGGGAPVDVDFFPPRPAAHGGDDRRRRGAPSP